MEVKIKFVEKSQNKKTGAITQTYSSCNTCPTRCPFKHNGCYAEYGPASIQWHSVKHDVNNLTNLIKGGATTKLIRHNVAGDIAEEGTSNISEELLTILNKAYKNHTAYTYTHCEVNERNINLAKSSKMVINFSCEELSQVEKAVKSGALAVMAVAKMSGAKKEINGIKYIKCPNTINSNIQCKDCKLCANRRRKSVIVFEAHGNGRKKASNFLIEI